MCQAVLKQIDLRQLWVRFELVNVRLDASRHEQFLQQIQWHVTDADSSNFSVVERTLKLLPRMQ
jgi:hypothetical protein